MAFKTIGSFTVLAVMAVLAGCGSGGSPTPDGAGGPDVEEPDPDAPAKPGDDELAELLDAAALLSDRVGALSITPASAMPQSGMATYMGYGGLVLDTPGGDTRLTGEATLTTDFAEGWISGRLDDIYSGSSDADSVEYDGRIRLRGDLGVLQPNGFDLEVKGDIEGGGQQIEVVGTASGDFLGPNAEALSLTADRDTLDFTVNGVSVGGVLEVVAED